MYAFLPSVPLALQVGPQTPNSILELTRVNCFRQKKERKKERKKEKEHKKHVMIS
jgi:hypothetical protein